MARHIGTSDTAARSPPGLDYSMLVEDDTGQDKAEEEEGSPVCLCKKRKGSGQAAVSGPYVAHPLAILSGAQCHLYHPVPLAMSKPPASFFPPGSLCSYSHSLAVSH